MRGRAWDMPRANLFFIDCSSTSERSHIIWTTKAMTVVVSIQCAHSLAAARLKSDHLTSVHRLSGRLIFGPYLHPPNPPLSDSVHRLPK